MPLFQVSNIVERAASIADIQDNFISATDWLTWFNLERVNQAVAAVRMGWTLTGVTSLSNASPGDTWTIPGSFLALIGVWEIDSSGRTRPLVAEDRFASFRQLSGGPITGPAERFTLTDGTDGSSTIALFPRPTSGTYIAVFANYPPLAGLAADTFNMPAGLEERIVLGMARRALIKEESDITDISRLIKLEDDKMEEFIWSRNLSEVAKIRNVDRVQRGWGYDTTYPPPSEWLLL